MTSWNSSSRPQTPGNSSRLFGNDFPLFDFPSFNLNRPMSENSSSIPNFFRPGSFFRHSEQTSQSNTRSPPPSQPSTSRTNNNGNRGDTCESCDACNSKFNLFKRRVNIFVYRWLPLKVNLSFTFLRKYAILAALSTVHLVSTRKQTLELCLSNKSVSNVVCSIVIFSIAVC